MKRQTNLPHSYPQQVNQNFDLKMYCKGVFVLFLICLIGLMTVDSFAQPLAEGKDKFWGCGTSSYISRYLERYWNQVTPGVTFLQSYR